MKTSIKQVERGKRISATKRGQLDPRLTKREAKLRRKYREIHGKVVDWVHYYTVEDGSLYVSIRFKDKTDFSLCFSPRIVTDRVELCNSTTDDFNVIRLFEGEEPPA